MESKHTRRGPQPPIDPAIVVPGAEFQKNRARDLGKPPVIVRVDEVIAIAAVETVFYHYQENGRRGNMPLAEFCQGSEHKIPGLLAEEPAPASAVQPVVDTAARLAVIEAQLAEVLALLRGAAAGPLFQRGR